MGLSSEASPSLTLPVRMTPMLRPRMTTVVALFAFHVFRRLVGNEFSEVWRGAASLKGQQI